ncbi:MAG: hypothetical protein ACPGU7_07895 [Gammaproteobacteria bacterium]
MSVDQRRSQAEACDSQVDAENGEAWEYWFDYYSRRAALEDEIESWRQVATPTAMDLHYQRTHIDDLKDQLRAMDEEVRDAIPVAAGMSNKGSAEWFKERARRAAMARHAKPGESHEKNARIRELWASGKYDTRDRCAEEECRDLGMSYSAARRALYNTPDPDRGS